jgi:hypothetical protein
MTSHACRGRTVDAVFCFQTGNLSEKATNRTQFNVAATRGREILKVYTDEWLKDAVSREPEHLMATEILAGEERTTESEQEAQVKSSAALGKMKHHLQFETVAEPEHETELEMEI